MRESSHGRAAESTGRTPVPRSGKPRDESKARPVTAETPRSYRRGMTNLSSHIAVGGATTTADTKQDIARRAFEIALFVAVAAALTGAWLAFFTLVPLDFRVH